MVYAVFIVFLIANLLLIPFGWGAMRVAGLILRIPKGLTAPTLLIMASVGAFAIDNDVSSLLIMRALGVLAVVMEGAGMPLVPLCSALCSVKSSRRTLSAPSISTQGDLLAFFDRPISAMLGIATIVIWTVPLLRLVYGRVAIARRSASGDAS